MQKRVYLFRIEVKGLPGSQLPSKMRGAFLNCVAAGCDAAEAEKKMRTALHEDKYELVCIDKIHLFNELSFDPGKPEDLEYIGMAKNSLEQDSVCYGSFCCWE